MTIPILTLDHGYVRFIEAWGTGEAGVANDAESPQHDYEVGIIEAARQSTQGSFRGWDTDAKLLSFLAESKPQHAGPFEFAGLVIEVQAPILVFREWHRHRTQSYNEMSARYASIPLERYTPTMERLLEVNNNGRNRQSGNIGDIQLSPENAQEWLKLLEASYALSQEAYRYGLAVGVAKELARCPMPVANYSRMRAAGNLRNWLAFMTLRCDPGAQSEIREYAHAVASIIRATFPRTMASYEKTK